MAFDYETDTLYSIRVRTTDLFGNYFEDTFKIVIMDVNEATGLPQQMNEGLKAYPNPFSQSTTVTFPNPSGLSCSMRLMDLSGKVVLTREGITQARFTIRAEELDRGYYLLEIQGDRIYRTKLVVK